MEQGRHIEKMAIVGDEKRRDDALAFTANGFRATAIELFTPSRVGAANLAELLESGALDQSPISALYEIS